VFLTMSMQKTAAGEYVRDAQRVTKNGPASGHVNVKANKLGGPVRADVLNLFKMQLSEAE
jgi:hypothetical protein